MNSIVERLGVVYNNNNFSVNSSFPRCAPSWKRSWIWSQREKPTIWRLVQWSLIFSLWLTLILITTSLIFAGINLLKGRSFVMILLGQRRIKNTNVDFWSLPGEEPRPRAVPSQIRLLRTECNEGRLAIRRYAIILILTKLGKMSLARFVFHAEHLRVICVRSSISCSCLYFIMNN